MAYQVPQRDRDEDRLDLHRDRHGLDLPVRRSRRRVVQQPREVLALRDEWQIGNDVIEKDWALGWVLAGFAAHPGLGGWVFKGGTALRKCHCETYRFSEDLGFTALAGGPEDPDEVTAVFTEIGHWVGENAGLELVDSRRCTEDCPRPCTLGAGGPTLRSMTARAGCQV